MEDKKTINGEGERAEWPRIDEINSKIVSEKLAFL